MSVVSFAEGLDLSQHVINAVVAYVLRWGRPPRVVLAVSDDDLRFGLADELRVRGFDVIEAIDARTLHAALGRALTWPMTQSVDLFIADAALEGCSPLHAFGYLRTRRLATPAILLTEESDPRRTEADRLDLDLCSRTHAIEAIDRTLLRVLRRRWSERPVAA